MPADARRAMGFPRIGAERGLTRSEFLAFAETRPNDERWELIEGQPVMNPAPAKWHQVIANNICVSLGRQRDQRELPWIAIPGVGAVVPASPRSLPQPDVMIVPHPLADPEAHFADDVLVLFEVLSRSNTRKDQTWRRRVYASIPNCLHYVTVEQKRAVVVSYDRAEDWKGRTVKGLDGSMALPGLGEAVTLSMSEIYRFTPVVPPGR